MTEPTVADPPAGGALSYILYNLLLVLLLRCWRCICSTG